MRRFYGSRRLPSSTSMEVPYSDTSLLHYQTGLHLKDHPHPIYLKVSQSMTVIVDMETCSMMLAENQELSFLIWVLIAHSLAQDE